MDQHRAIDLGQDVVAYDHLQVRTDAQDVSVERRVVQLAQDEPVGYDRSSTVSVAHDVCRIDKLTAPQAADGAAALVGTKDGLPETRLVHPCLHLVYGRLLRRLDQRVFFVYHLQ